MTSERPGARALNRQMATGADYSLVGMDNARHMLLAGFTTVRDLGGFDFADLAVKHAVDRGAIVGPRMLVACQLISSLAATATRPTVSVRAFIWRRRMGSPTARTLFAPRCGS